VVSVLGFALSVGIILWMMAAREKVVCVDSVKLLGNYKGMIDAKNELKGKSSALQARLDTLLMEVEKSIKEYEGVRAKSSSREVRLMEELIETKQRQYEEYKNAVQAQLQKSDQELSNRVLTKIDAFVKKFGKEKGYNLILAGKQNGSIIYVILRGLNKEYSK
jgi:outer membrane protein